MDNAIAQQYTGIPLGAEESQGSNRIYVSLRTGKICQTDRNQLPGYKPAQTKNKDETINNFFAKEYDKLTGFVTDIRWHTHKLKDGTVLSGWNVTIDTTKEVYVLQVGTNDRPFERFMNVLLGVDFENPVMFVAFMGKNKQTGAPQKVLLLSQEMSPELDKNGKPKPLWLQPILEEKWLARSVINKCKQAIPLTAEEETHVSRNADGTVNWNYPYISQGVDEKWSLDAWRNHLHENVQEHVLPNVKAANNSRGEIVRPGFASASTEPIPEDDSTSFSAPPLGAVNGPEDDIPF